MRDVRIYDRSDLRKYRTETPNTVVKGRISKKLSVHAKFLYVYLKSVAGDNGECWQSTKTLAEGAGMSAGTVSKCKRELAKNGLIEIDKGDHKKGKSDVITIVDIWGKNMLEYASNQAPSSNEHPPSPHECTPSSDESTCSSYEPKKEPYNQERTQEEQCARECSVVERIDSAETYKDLIPIWTSYLRDKGKKVNNYTMDTLQHSWRQRDVDMLKRSMLHSIEHDWMRLIDPLEGKEKPTDRPEGVRPDAVIVEQHIPGKILSNN